ncbi:MAG TPA: hypothetical protein PLG63_05500 [bacterium]|nr:hypothetical protein [bacterium]HPM47199.1 hypothetical protein [bacterium]
MKNAGLFFCIVVFSFGLNAKSCFKASVVKPSPFMGNNGEIFELSDGSLWEVENEYEYLYEYYPSVVVCPSKGKLIIKKKSLDIKLVSAARISKQSDSKSPISKQTDFIKTNDWELYEETSLQGSVSGTVKKGSIFKTTSGNIYEVTGFTLQLVMELQPEVVILRKGNIYKLVVEGFDEPLVCKCLSCSSERSETLPKNEPTTEVSSVIESIIISDFKGLKHGNIYKLANGQIWEQTEAWIWIWIWVNPSVIIWKEGGGFRMKVENIEHAVSVQRVK